MRRRQQRSNMELVYIRLALSAVERQASPKKEPKTHLLHFSNVEILSEQHHGAGGIAHAASPATKNQEQQEGQSAYPHRSN